MALFSDSVPREMYEDMRQQREAAQQRFDDLLNKYHALRPLQSAANPIKIIPPKPDSAAQTLAAVEQAAHDPRIEAAVKKLMEENQRLGPAAALREAKKLLDLATGKADAPSFTLGPSITHAPP